MMEASFTEVFETRELTVDATTPRPHSSTTITGVADDGTFEREKPVGMPGTDDPEATSKFVSINHQIDSDYDRVVEFVAHSDDVHFQPPSAKQIQTEQISEEFHLDNVEERTFVAVKDGETVELTEGGVFEHFGVDMEGDEDDDDDQEATETADDGGDLMADGGQVKLDDEWEQRAEELHQHGGIPKRRAKAAALREQGLVYREIAEELGDTSKASVSEMLDNVQADIDQAKWLVENPPELSAPTDKVEFDTLSDLLEAIRGKGWVRADTANSGEEVGFEVCGHEWSHLSHSGFDGGWEKINSWTTGGGEGFTLYRAEIADETVDMVQQRVTFKRDGETKRRWKCFIAVHGGDGRGVTSHEFKNESMTVTQAALK